MRLRALRWMVPAVAAVALIGCSSDDEDPITVASSPPLTAPSGSGSSTSPASPQDVIVRTYTTYWEVSERAAGMSIPQARRALARYSTPGLIDQQITGIRQLQEQDREPWGRVIHHVSDVRITGGTALLKDCQDVRGAGLADARTHQLIPNTRNPESKPLHLAATLRRGSDAQWRVSAVLPEETPCTYATSRT